MVKRPANTNQTQIIFMCSAEQTQFIDAEAKRQSITRTSVVRALIQDKIRSRQNKSPRTKCDLAKTGMTFLV